jgi:hypothetical protein
MVRVTDGTGSVVLVLVEEVGAEVYCWVFVTNALKFYSVGEKNFLDFTDSKYVFCCHWSRWK